MRDARAFCGLSGAFLATASSPFCSLASLWVMSSRPWQACSAESAPRSSLANASVIGRVATWFRPLSHSKPAWLVRRANTASWRGSATRSFGSLSTGISARTLPDPARGAAAPSEDPVDALPRRVASRSSWPPLVTLARREISAAARRPRTKVAFCDPGGHQPGPSIGSAPTRGGLEAGAAARPKRARARGEAR